MAKDLEDGRGIRSQTSAGLEIQHQPAGLGTTAIASNDPARVSVTVKTVSTLSLAKSLEDLVGTMYAMCQHCSLPMVSAQEMALVPF